MFIAVVKSNEIFSRLNWRDDCLRGIVRPYAVELYINASSYGESGSYETVSLVIY